LSFSATAASLILSGTGSVRASGVLCPGDRDPSQFTDAGTGTNTKLATCSFQVTGRHKVFTIWAGAGYWHGIIHTTTVVGATGNKETPDPRETAKHSSWGKSRSTNHNRNRINENNPDSTIPYFFASTTTSNFSSHCAIIITIRDS
jgi:hypothetical protein